MKNIFSLFTVSANTFEGKRENEVVLLCLHRHWFTLFGTFVFAFFGALLPFVLIVIFGSAIVDYGLGKIVVFLFVAYYMVGWYTIGYTFTMYLMDIWIVTNQRVIDSTQNGFFNRAIAEISLKNIQDVATSVNGLIPTLMNFGDVDVQSAGEIVHFKFKQIPNPQNVKDVISKATREYRDAQLKSEATEMAREIEKAKIEIPEETIPTT